MRKIHHPSFKKPRGRQGPLIAMKTARQERRAASALADRAGRTYMEKDEPRSEQSAQKDQVTMRGLGTVAIFVARCGMLTRSAR
jgi:hypothetical protein